MKSATTGRLLRQLIATLLLYFSLPGLASGASYRFVTLEFPPLEYADSKGEVKGAAVDIVRRIMKDLGHKVTIELLPWTRSLTLVKAGQADAIFTAYRNEERAQFLDYSNETLVDQVVALYMKRDSKFIYDGNLNALAPFNIGVVSTISYGAKFDQARDSGMFKTDRAETMEQNFKKLLADRIDMVVSNSFTADDEIKRLGLSGQIRKLVVPVEVIPSYVAFSKERKLTKLRDQFDTALRNLKKSGAYGRILADHGVTQK